MLKEPTVILSACRTAIGTFGGSLKDVSASDLGAVVIREAIARAEVEARASATSSWGVCCRGAPE